MFYSANLRRQVLIAKPRLYCFLDCMSFICLLSILWFSIKINDFLNNIVSFGPPSELLRVTRKCMPQVMCIMFRQQWAYMCTLKCQAATGLPRWQAGYEGRLKETAVPGPNMVPNGPKGLLILFQSHEDVNVLETRGPEVLSLGRLLDRSFCRSLRLTGRF